MDKNYIRTHILSQGKDELFLHGNPWIGEIITAVIEPIPSRGKIHATL